MNNLPEKAPNVPITRANWRTIWRNIASKHIPSGSRSFWYVLAKDKLPLRETLYRHTDKEGWIQLIALNVLDKTKI
jgi:hypothetical protein